MTIVIQKPLENIKIAGKNVKAVGIPEWRLEGEPSMVTVDIQYKYLKGKYKERQFPYPLQISKSEILKGEKRLEQTAGGKEQLFYIIPVSKMTEVKPKTEPVIIKVEQRNLSDTPKYPCTCFSTKFWRTPWKQWLCFRCHPPIDDDVEIAEIADIAEKAEIK